MNQFSHFAYVYFEYFLLYLCSYFPYMCLKENHIFNNMITAPNIQSYAKASAKSGQEILNNRIHCTLKWFGSRYSKNNLDTIALQLQSIVYILVYIEIFSAQIRNILWFYCATARRFALKDHVILHTLHKDIRKKLYNH